MATTHSLPPDFQALEQGSRTQALELMYEKALRKSDLVYEAEKMRKLRVEMELLGHEKDDLHLILLEANDSVNDLRQSEQELQINLQATEMSLESVQAELRSKCREVENLKTELKSFNDISSNSTKLLTEKLALSRELASLRPELEHFRSQAVSHQSTLAEKLSLQRQLSSIQIELHNEKNATQRALAKGDGRQELAAKLETQLDDIKSELMQERRERQKAERDFQRASAEHEIKKTVIESRLEAFRNKLRATKEQLKETQAELQQVRNTKLSSNLKVTPHGRELAKESRKRSLAEIDNDATIGTPGMLPLAKKGKRGSTIPGDKSTFSITPYLNRAASLALESPTEEQNASKDKHEDNTSDKVAKGKNSLRKDLAISEKPVSAVSDQISESGVTSKKCNMLTVAKASKSNRRGASVRTAKNQTVLEQVQEENHEENDDENLPPVSFRQIPPQGSVKSIIEEPRGSANEETTFIKRKRKLLSGGLGRTLFDDDENGKGGNQAAPKGSRTLGDTGKGGLGKSNSRLPAMSSNKTVEAFSPLKKDRKRAKNDASLYGDGGGAIGRRAFNRYSSSSSKRWQTRQGNDAFAKEARVQGLKSRAAFKLLEINQRYKVFDRGQTVVDLGYAPGSWSQVAQDRTWPNGRVIGIDIIPAQPPKGVSTIQGNFLSEAVQEEVKKYLRDPTNRKLRRSSFLSTVNDGKASSEGEVDASETNYVELEARMEHSPEALTKDEQPIRHKSQIEAEEAKGRMVDVVLSDMSAPWEQTTGYWQRSLSNPYYRMMNTSGMSFRDHAGSMDLCNAALKFAFDTLRGGGHFVCKFYQGAEDKILETRLKTLFTKVHREKPESSRSESKESYFVALRRKPDSLVEHVFRDL